MKWFEIIELICSIISTIGIILSAIVISYNYLKRIDIYVSYENKHLRIFATALYKQIMLKSIEIKTRKKINENDDFFANGRNEITLDADQMTTIKELYLENFKYNLVFVKIILLNNKKIHRICLVRR